MLNYGLIIAIAAIAISLFSLWFNWNHSESLFRRKEYPAVLWHKPKISKQGDNTIITTLICNHGPKDITDLFFTGLLCRGFKSEAWCKSKRVKKLPINEELTLYVTTELEKDISERFHGLQYEKVWRFKNKPKRYKMALRLEYLPFIAEAPYFVEKRNFILTPTTESGEIASWGIKQIPKGQGWLPWF